jgi:hypothetical protein
VGKHWGGWDGGGLTGSKAAPAEEGGCGGRRWSRRSPWLEERAGGRFTTQTGRTVNRGGLRQSLPKMGMAVVI